MKFKPLDGIDLKVAQTLRLGMDSGTFLTVEYIYGFELFGSYETFRGGWRITDPKVMDFRSGLKGTFPLKVEDERIENAIAKWVAAREQSETARTQTDAVAERVK